MTANKGDWVQIYNVLLEPSERAAQIPEDTKRVPFEMRVNGFVLNNAQIGSIVSVKTLAGRIVEGKLIRIFLIMNCHMEITYLKFLKYQADLEPFFTRGNKQCQTICINP